MADDDIEQAADQAAAGQVPARPCNCDPADIHGYVQHRPYCGLEPGDMAPAAGQVPAEAVEVLRSTITGQKTYVIPTAVWREAVEATEAVIDRLSVTLTNREAAQRVLAAAAPLIVADRWDVEQCDHCGEVKRVAWWYEKGEAAVCGECHEAELLERDRLRAEVDRLTAERDAARRDTAAAISKAIMRATTSDDDATFEAMQRASAIAREVGNRASDE